MDNTARQRMAKLLNERAVVRGQVRLASGRVSDFYVDGKQVTLCSEGAELVGELLWEAMHNDRVDAIGGPEIGAIPMATAAVIHYQRQGRHLEGFSVRKQPKEHGMQRRIEGRLEPGMRVVVVEDVITTGGSVLKAIDEIRSAGAEIVKVVCLLDRQEGAAETFAAAGLRYEPIFTRADLESACASS